VASDPHENLLSDFPGAISAACDDGFVTIEYRGKGRPALARCSRCAHERIRNAVAAFTPPRFRRPIAVPAAVTVWAERGTEAQGLYLAGPVGTGKTHAAWIAVAAWCLTTGTTPGNREDRRPPVVCASMTDLLDDFRPGDASVRRVRDCQQAALLVIDDLGAEKRRSGRRSGSTA
jgi:DNA replication protein DnaC